MVTGETDATGHGPITYYDVPFIDGTFSLSWKVDVEQHFVFVFDVQANGKATHAMTVYVNGSPGVSDVPDTMTVRLVLRQRAMDSANRGRILVP